MKPLYSFAGLGVTIGPTAGQLAAVPASERHKYVLQERVNFVPCIATPEGPAKVEIRVMYIWLEELQPVNLIIRMGRGTQMGVDHNKDLRWVGASAAFIEGGKAMTLLCLAGYEKGHEFLREAKRQGCTVILLSSLRLKETAKWPMDSIDEIFYMPDTNGEWDRGDTIKSVSYLARTREIDRIVALDDFDAEMGASLREHLRLPGMGETQVRLFRDKLAMRMGAHAAGIRVPEFSAVFHHGRLNEFLTRAPGPWVLKPRSLAGAIGIKKIHTPEELWPQLEVLGDMQSHYLLERFVPGRVFHVDTLLSAGEMVFARASGYGRPPMEVSHGGGVFTTEVLDHESDETADLLELNRRLLTAFGLTNGVSHTEFIRAEADGKIYFLETSARVGGAHISDLIEAATGLNLWAEWAKIECAQPGHRYAPSRPREDYAGLLVSLSREEHPDMSSYNDPEIVWRMDNPYHVGLIVKSPDRNRVRQLVADYARRIQHDFGATLPPRDRPDA